MSALRLLAVENLTDPAIKRALVFLLSAYKARCEEQKAVAMRTNRNVLSLMNGENVDKQAWLAEVEAELSEIDNILISLT